MLVKGSNKAGGQVFLHIIHIQTDGQNTQMLVKGQNINASQIWVLYRSNSNRWSK